MYLANFLKLNKLVFRLFYENLTVFEAIGFFKNENTFKINNLGSVVVYISVISATLKQVWGR